MDTQFSIAKIVDKAQTSVSELVSLIEQNVKTIIVNNVIILFGTRLNDEMAKYVASDVIKLMLKKDIKVKNSNA